MTESKADPSRRIEAFIHSLPEHIAAFSDASRNLDELMAVVQRRIVDVIPSACTVALSANDRPTSFDPARTLTVPLTLHDRSLGIITLARSAADPPFDREDLEIAGYLAPVAALAVAAAQTSMSETSRLKSEFLANMSHELRTPLNAIIGFADLMFKGKVGPVAENHREYLGDILSSSRHLLHLINDVLDLAKVESGQLEFRPERVDLSLLISEVRDILRGLAASKQIWIGLEIARSIEPALVDPGKLKQVLYNYLSNALKFTPNEGRVTVRLSAEDGDRFRIEVEDTGIGIREEDMHRLFVEFQQLDAGLSKKFAGTGLGLALTKRIVEAQGGSVGARSQLGRGSTFWAVLPRVTRSMIQSSKEQPMAAPGAISDVRPVLVIDDDIVSLRSIETALRHVGRTAVCVSSASSALEAIELQAPAMIVLDLLMPEMRGLQLLIRLRQNPNLDQVPIVVWTAKDPTEAERNQISAMAQAILPKGTGGTEIILELVRGDHLPSRGSP